MVVYMKRLPPPYDAALDLFPLRTMHGHRGRRDHALFVMGQLHVHVLHVHVRFMYMCSMYMLWVNSMHLIKNQPDRNCAHTVMVGFL